MDDDRTDADDPKGDVPEELRIAHRRFRITRARRADVPALVGLLRGDVLGAQREGDDSMPYLAAFDALDTDPAHLLVAVRDEQDEIVATMQLSLLPNLARRGAWRLQIETLHVAAGLRGVGVGSAMMRWAANYGRRHGARVAQLTSDKRRTDAHRFYDRLGYRATHEGLKLRLDQDE